MRALSLAESGILKSFSRRIRREVKMSVIWAFKIQEVWSFLKQTEKLGLRSKYR